MTVSSPSMEITDKKYEAEAGLLFRQVTELKLD